MNNLYLLCGLPGSGKSTWAKEKVKEDNYKTIILNRDSLREMFYGHYGHFDRMIESHMKFYIIDMVKDLLYNGYDVIIDETNITKKNRLDYIDSIKESTILKTVDINIVYFPKHENNLKWRISDSRGETREKWESIIQDMENKFEEPTEDEGKIITIRN